MSRIAAVVAWSAFLRALQNQVAPCRTDADLERAQLRQSLALTATDGAGQVGRRPLRRTVTGWCWATTTQLAVDARRSVRRARPRVSWAAAEDVFPGAGSLGDDLVSLGTYPDDDAGATGALTRAQDLANELPEPAPTRGVACAHLLGRTASRARRALST
ncbi:hypothetical protein ATM99_09135 [Cellulomonas sp. B6]|nr:hypothetical protein ATM99_09135 [Cellulomonas sp. B6]